MRTCGSVRLTAGETLVHVVLTQALAPATASKTKPLGKVMVTVGTTVPTLNCVVIARRSPSAYWPRFKCPSGRSSQGKSVGVMISARHWPSVKLMAVEAHSGARAGTSAAPLPS